MGFEAHTQAERVRALRLTSPFGGPTCGIGLSCFIGRNYVDANSPG